MTTTQNTGSNLKPALDALKKDIRSLGEQSGLGRDSREKLAIALSRAAHNGIIDDKDVPDLVAEYITSEGKKLLHNNSANGIKVMESKCRQIVSMSIPKAYDFLNTLERAVEIRKALRQTEGTELKPGFESYVELAREVKDVKRSLTDDEITGKMLKPVREDKTDIERMQDEYARLYKMAKGTKERAPMPEVEPVVEAMGAAIKNAGGDIPAVSKEEKKAEEAIKFLASVGKLAA